MNLDKMSVAQLKEKLIEVKNEFKETAADVYTPERQEQILKGKGIRGSVKQQKQSLISQINKISAATNKVGSVDFVNNYQANVQFSKDIAAAKNKVEQRRMELLKKGTYETRLGAKEKTYYWCDCMGFSRNDLTLLLSVYTFEELSEMSGDEFYDEMQDAKLSYERGKGTVPKEQTDEDATKAATRDGFENTDDVNKLIEKATQEAEKKGYEGKRAQKYIERRVGILKIQEERKAARNAKKEVEKEQREFFKKELGQNIRKEEFAQPVDKRVTELNKLKERKKKRKEIDLTSLL